MVRAGLGGCGAAPPANRTLHFFESTIKTMVVIVPVIMIYPRRFRIHMDCAPRVEDALTQFHVLGLCGGIRGIWDLL